jgi:hypothetical protein
LPKALQQQVRKAEFRPNVTSCMLVARGAARAIST